MNNLDLRDCTAKFHKGSAKVHEVCSLRNFALLREPQCNNLLNAMIN
jgi:hypothetical protein